LVAPPGVDQAKFQDAFNACRSQLPTGNFGAGGGSGGTAAVAGGHAIVYKVTGNTANESVVYSDTGGSNDASATLPYTKTVQLPSGYQYSIVAEGSGAAATSVRCEVTVDGKSVVTATAATGLADCHGTVP